MLIDPLIEDSFQLDMSEALGKNFPAPILDIIDFNDLEQERSAKQRLNSSRAAGALTYIQVSQSLKKGESLQKSLVRRVRFWLEKYAPGMVIPGRGAR